MLTEIKDIAEEIQEKTEGRCEICHGAGQQLHHAINGNGKRIPYQTQYSVYNLCEPCHRLVHEDRFEDLRLKFETQNRYKELGYEEDKVRELMGGALYIRDSVERVFNRRGLKVDDCIVESVMKGLL